MNEIVVLSDRVKATKKGLIIKGDLTFNEWEGVGKKLNTIEGAVHWWIGDWLNYGEKHYGETYAQAVEETGYAYGTVANDKYVSSRIEFSRRRENLSLGHHQTVASLEPEEQDKLLSLAVELNMPISTLRTEVYKYQNFSVAQLEAGKTSGVYDVVVIDPPWKVEKIVRQVAPKQGVFDYPTMELDKIAEIKIPAASNCHVFLWTTHKYLPDAFELFKIWNFSYICTFTWHKDGGFQPFGLPMYNNEFVLYGHNGSPKFIDFTDFMTCFSAKRKAHSEKPEEFYETLRRVTAGRRLDMFNRRKIEGFDGFGNEAVIGSLP